MTARKSALRTVKPGEKAPEVRPKTVTEAASSGTDLELMVAMRDRIAVAVENPNTPARDLAALTKRLAETVKEISAIRARAEQEADEHADDVSDEAFDASAI